MPFSLILAPFYTPTNGARGFRFLHILMTPLSSPGVAIVAVLMGTRRQLTVGVICIPVMAKRAVWFSKWT